MTATQFGQDVLDGLGALAHGSDEALVALVDAVPQEFEWLIDVANPASGDSWQLLFDPDNTPAEALDWLAQTNGTVFPPGMTVAEKRVYIRQETSWQRGRVSSIVAAVQRFLTAPKNVSILERDSSPYHFTVIIRAAQAGIRLYAKALTLYPTYTARLAAEPTYADVTSNIDVITAAIVAAKPAGLQFTLTVLIAHAYFETLALHPTYTNALAALPTYADRIADQT